MARDTEHIEIALDAGNLPDPNALRAVFVRDAESIHSAAGRPAVGRHDADGAGL